MSRFSEFFKRSGEEVSSLEPKTNPEEVAQMKEWESFRDRIKVYAENVGGYLQVDIKKVPEQSRSMSSEYVLAFYIPEAKKDETIAFLTSEEYVFDGEEGNSFAEPGMFRAVHSPGSKEYLMRVTLKKNVET